MNTSRGIANTLLAIGRLLRLSLLPTAVADVACGLLMGNGGVWPTGAMPWIAILGSLGVYHGAMALNDWADREHDRATRPTRPLASGQLTPAFALGLGSFMIVAGVTAFWSIDVRAGVWMSTVALLAVLYDVAGRGPWLGPTLLGLCRLGNMGIGLALPLFVLERGPVFRELLFLPAVAYGLYVFFISRLGRMEDAEDDRPLGQRPRKPLRAALACLLVVPFLRADRGLQVGTLLSFIVAWSAGIGLARLAWTHEPWTRERVEYAMGCALRRLLLFALSGVLLVATERPDVWITAALVLAGYPLALALRRVFPPS
jgi:4-hydroxybenzoate polyprenyltransferase